MVFHSSYRRLAAAVMLQAAKDREQSQYRSEVIDFVRSPWFDRLAQVIEVDPAAAREKFLSGQLEPVQIRASYR